LACSSSSCWSYLCDVMWHCVWWKG
jgi:hypothetical protein